MAFMVLFHGSPEPMGNLNRFSDQDWFIHCPCCSEKEQRRVFSDFRARKAPYSQLLEEEYMCFKNNCFWHQKDPLLT